MREICDYNVKDIICDLAVFQLGYYVIGYKQLIILDAFITMNTNVRACMPQMSGCIHI